MLVAGLQCSSIEKKKSLTGRWGRAQTLDRTWRGRGPFSGHDRESRVTCFEVLYYDCVTKQRQIFSVRTVKSKRLYKTRKPRTDCAVLSPPVSCCCVTPPMFHHLLHRDQVPAHHEACQPTPQHTHTAEPVSLCSSVHHLLWREGMFKDLNIVSIRELSKCLDASQCGRWRCFMDGVRSLEPTQTDGWLMSMVDFQASAGQLSFIVLLLFCFKLWANINLALLRWGHVAEGCRDQLQG